MVTGRQYAGLVRDQLPGLPEGNLILEPVGRDTAPAVGLASLVVAQRHLPGLHAGLTALVSWLDRPDAREMVRAQYEELPRVSIDYGVMEKAEDVYVLPADMGWDDVGGWLSLDRLTERDAAGNVARGRAVAIDCEGCTIDAEGRLVVAVGVRDLLIVDTPDALLVCHKGRAGDLKQVVARLRDQGLERHL